MTDVRDELWAELLEAGKVRWMPRMLDAKGWLCVGRQGRQTFLWWHVRHGALSAPPDQPPDWDDPATLGCLLAMAREACGEGELHAAWSVFGGEWRVWSLARVLAGGSTEAEALLRAIAGTSSKRTPCPACITAIRDSADDVVELHARCAKAIANPVESLRLVERVRATVGHWRDQQAEACLCGACDVLLDEGGEYECPAIEAIGDVLDDLETDLEGKWQAKAAP